MSIVFTADDIELFAAASHDRNPLHLSADYGRKTHFGQQVAYGVLGALAAIAKLPVPASERISKLSVEFPRPMLLGVEYRIVVNGPESAALMDGSTALAKVQLKLTPGGPLALRTDAPAPAPREVADRLDETQLQPGLTRTGQYRPDPESAARLFQRFGLNPDAWGSLPLTALLWSSYVTGMELPGERALFYTLTLRFPASNLVRGNLDWSTTLRSKNGLNQLRSDVRLSVNSAGVAEGQIKSFLRPNPVVGSAEPFARSRELEGKTALVTGASRGLGAAITRALAMRGATVLANFQHSVEDASRLSDSGRVILCQGDAGDVEWCRALHASHPRLDFLVLNACPSILPMRVELDTVERINAYVTRALAMVSIPLSVFGASIANRTVLISSSMLDTAARDFPQYVAAKSAAEALIRAVARQYTKPGYLIVRPPKLMTDMMNTPFGSDDARPPETVAAWIAGQLCAEGSPGVVVTPLIS